MYRNLSIKYLIEKLRKSYKCYNHRSTEIQNTNNYSQIFYVVNNMLSVIDFKVSL